MKNEINPTFKRGAHHNYLVLSGSGDREYDFNMFTENLIQGLLPAQVRYDDGEEKLYYEISSLQPLSRMFDHKTMKGEDYKTVIRGILKAFEGMGEFLLKENSILLEPKYIYMGPESGVVRLLYYPFCEEENGFQKLSEYFIDHADHEEAESVRISYDFYKLVRQENFVVGDFFELLERKTTSEKESEKKKRQEYFLDEEDQDYSMNEERKWEENRTDRLPQIPYEDFSECEEDKIEPKKEGKKEGRTEEKKGFFMSGKVKLPSGLGKISNLILKPKEETEETENESESKGNIYEEKIFAIKEEHSEIAIKETNLETREEYGKTTFFENLEEEEERKLVQTNKGKDLVFDLSSLPKTVGKIEGMSDFVIKDGSISRMHARFLEKNGRVYIEDCNSTNGTYVNNIRLNEEESILLESGDEVKFGKVVFEYR